MKTKKNSKTKSVVEEYKCDIYGFILVVANQYTTLEQLKEKYVLCNGELLTEEVIQGQATTSRCMNKETKEYVFLVKFNHYTGVKGEDKTLSFINTVSHEATHVAIDVYDLCDQMLCSCSPEPFCYLQGWAAERIYKTLTK